MQEFQAVRQLWPQTMQPAYYPYESSSSRAGQVGFAAASYDSFVPTDTESDPASSPYSLSAGAIQYQPASSNTSTSQYYYQTHHAVPHRSTDASYVPDYTRGRTRTVIHPSGIPSAQPVRWQPRTLEETRSALLSGAPMDLQLVTFPDSAAHVVDLLLHHNADGGVRRR
jgi:hypothetical protein